MNNWRGIVAVGLVFCLYHASLIQSLGAASVDAESIRQQVAELGVGAKVGLKLAGGKKLRGSIEAIDDQGFLLSERSQPGVHVSYSDVGQVKLAQRAYRAKGETDPAEARRVVLSLGVGRHADNNLTVSRSLVFH